MITSQWEGCAIGQAVRHWSLTMDVQVQSHANPRRICGGQSGIGTDISFSVPSYSSNHLSLIPYNLCS